MSWFQLDPESIANRARAENSAVPSLASSVLGGAFGFTVVSLAGFAPWAGFGRWFYKNVGELGLYVVCAIVFIGLSAPLLHRLIIGPGALSRFYKLFGISFIAYAVAWIVAYMAIRGHAGGVAGLAAGTAIMGWMLATAFDARASTFKVILALFALNAAGYFIGGEIEGALIRKNALLAKFMWGVCYGLGLGAGLGYAFHECQRSARALLSSAKSVA